LNLRILYKMNQARSQKEESQSYAPRLKIGDGLICDFKKAEIQTRSICMREKCSRHKLGRN